MDKLDRLKAIGLRIKTRRESLGMSQESLAEKVGYKSRSSINKIELGKNDIVQSTIVKLADALETTPAYLMGWNEEDQAPALEKEITPTLTEKDERDIEKRLESVLEELESGQSDLAFSGEPLDEVTRELLVQSLRNSMEIGKTLAKQKFTPKKYRKE